MAKQVVQYRYYNSSDTTHNQPNVGSNTRIKWISGSIFFSTYDNLNTITQLGIQALPGTKFYLNNGVEPILIGSTGIYELDLENLSEITALSFDSDSIAEVDSNDNAYIIVDAIYNVEE